MLAFQIQLNSRSHKPAPLAMLARVGWYCREEICEGPPLPTFIHGKNIPQVGVGHALSIFCFDAETYFYHTFWSVCAMKWLLK